MPTGYTAGILSGETKTFQDFAKQCMRNFGACIHMRDLDFDKEYEPRIPSDYNSKRLIELKEKLLIANTYSDENIIELKKTELEKSLEYHSNKIKEVENQNKIMLSFLDSANKYTPPTKEHEGIKNFMIDQLVKTIEFDCDNSYSINEISKIEIQLKNLDVNAIRFEMINLVQSGIDYHLKYFNDELKRCAESNKWAADFLFSLNCT